MGGRERKRVCEMLACGRKDAFVNSVLSARMYAFVGVDGCMGGAAKWLHGGESREPARRDCRRYRGVGREKEDWGGGGVCQPQKTETTSVQASTTWRWGKRLQDLTSSTSDRLGECTMLQLYILILRKRVELKRCIAQSVSSRPGGVLVSGREGRACKCDPSWPGQSPWGRGYGGKDAGGDSGRGSARVAGRRSNDSTALMLAGGSNPQHP